MGKLSPKIEALLEEANDCELVAGLATTKEIRDANLARAVELRRLAAEARGLDRPQPTLFSASPDREI